MERSNALHFVNATSTYRAALNCSAQAVSVLVTTAAAALLVSNSFRFLVP